MFSIINTFRAFIGPKRNSFMLSWFCLKSCCKLFIHISHKLVQQHDQHKPELLLHFKTLTYSSYAVFQNSVEVKILTFVQNIKFKCWFLELRTWQAENVLIVLLGKEMQTKKYIYISGLFPERFTVLLLDRRPQ
jgi:hypothetical protein